MAATVEFIIGRAGSGKTHTLFERLAAVQHGDANRRAEKCIVIVADQATFETERALSERLGGGLFNCEVYSWSSLSRAVLTEKGDRRAYLSPQGRVMLTRRSIDACASKLVAFASVSGHEGFPAECDSVFRQFKRCGITPSQLKTTAGELQDNSPLKAKLIDFALLYDDCERRMLERYIDSEDMMNELAAYLPQSSFAKSHVFIDGGDTMNEQSYRVFDAMLKTALSVTVTLTIDSGRGARDYGVFVPETRVFERMSAILKQAGCQARITTLTQRNGRTAPLWHLEKELYSHPFKKYADKPYGISLYKAADRQDEVAEAAEQLRLAAKKGIRYRDMAVVVSDLSGYAPIISRVFGACGIPYFTDIKRSVGTHPISELIIASLMAVERGFDSDNVLRVLKTGYCGASRADAELFENCVIKYGLWGKRLTESFTNSEFLPQTDIIQQAEKARSCVMEPLCYLRDRIRAGSDATTKAKALFDYLEKLNVYGQQKALCQALHESGNFELEEENAQVVNSVMELLDQLYAILGDEDIGLTRFIAVVKQGLLSYEVGVIPTTCDQALVGNIGRTRSREVEFLQVLGMNDGIFPKKHTDDGIIDDSDLKKLRELGLPVWESCEQLSESDALEIYSILAKPKRLLRFSYPISVEGATAQPCSLVSVIKSIFPLIEETDGVISTPFRGNPNMALLLLARRMRSMIDAGVYDDTAAELYAYFRRLPEYRDTVDTLTEQYFGSSSPSPFGMELAGRLYGNALYGSASRLEQYNSCPFRHFIQYGLGAREREIHAERPVNTGDFYHNALELYTRYVMENELDWSSLTDEAVLDILRELLPPLIAEHNNGILLETARLRARLHSMLETVRATACAMTRQIARGKFRPVGSEVRFGSKDAMLPALTLRLSNGSVFHVSGIIDRVDMWRSDTGDAHYRIIDYKTNGKTFNYGELLTGLQLQLPLYAAALEAAENTEMAMASAAMAGIYYMPVIDLPPTAPMEKSDTKQLTDELLEKFRLNGLSLSDASIIDATDDFSKKSIVINAERTSSGGFSGTGLVSRNEFDSIMERAVSCAANTLKAIMAGHAQIRPYKHISNKKSACTYCPLGSVCRFDADTDSYRIVRSVSENEFLGRER